MASLSPRARRLLERRRRQRRGTPLNLVSLMDIFTILVFFLLVNSSDVQTLPSGKGLQMPESVADMPARETIVVKVTPEQIAVDGHTVLSVAALTDAEPSALEPLRDALRARTDDAAATEITLMADRSLPYSLLKKIMSTCAEAQFERVSLAVIQRAPGAEAG